MLASRRPLDLGTFTVVEADYHESGFKSHLTQLSYLRRDIVDWLTQIDGEVYWELSAKDEYVFNTQMCRYVSEFAFVFYFRRASDAVLFKLIWFDGD